MELREFLQSFLDNSLIGKSVKFDFKKKSYDYQYIDTFEDYKKTFNLDDTLTEEDVYDTESYKSFLTRESNPEVYFINLKFFDFDHLISTLINDLKLIVREDGVFNWNYLKSHKLIFLLINNIDKVDEDEYGTLNVFIKLLNSKKEYNNKFIVIDKRNEKVYNYYNLYFVNKYDILEVLKGNIFDNIYEQVLKLIDIELTKKGIDDPEEYLEKNKMVLYELFRLVTLEIVRDKEKQNFKKNIVEKFINWALSPNSPNRESKLNNQVMIFNDFVIVNDLKQEVKKYDKILKNYTFYKTKKFTKSNKLIETSEISMLKIN